MDSREEIPRPGGTLVIVTILLVTASWLSYLVPIVIENFDDTLRTLGSNLPPATRFLLATRHAWVIFVVLAVPLFIWVIARSRVTREELRRMKLAIRLLTVVMVLAYGIAAWAVFVPFFRMGEVV